MEGVWGVAVGRDGDEDSDAVEKVDDLIYLVRGVSNGRRMRILRSSYDREALGRFRGAVVGPDVRPNLEGELENLEHVVDVVWIRNFDAAAKESV